MRRAEQARRDGNEGMARVCARRAAGAAAGEYLRRAGLAAHTAAYDNLRLLASQAGLPDEVVEAVGNLLVRITPEHTLPGDADLIDAARRLRSLLLGE